MGSNQRFDQTDQGRPGRTDLLHQEPRPPGRRIREHQVEGGQGHFFGHRRAGDRGQHLPGRPRLGECVLEADCE